MGPPGPAQLRGTALGGAGHLNPIETVLATPAYKARAQAIAANLAATRPAEKVLAGLTS